MKKYIDGFNGLLLAIMFLITFWQIIARFIPGDATVWSEEVARFVFVWIVFLGAATLIRDDEHIRISIIIDRLGPLSGKLLRIFSAALIIPFVVFMTLGAEGCVAAEGSNAVAVPGFKVQPPLDFVGAGDTFHAAIAASLAAGSTAREAALMGNLAASVTVAKVGTTGTASPEEILRQHRKHAAEGFD